MRIAVTANPWAPTSNSTAPKKCACSAYGHALRRFGPGVKVSVDETPDGTYRVQLRDAEQNLIREQEFNHYGDPVRGGRRD